MPLIQHKIHNEHTKIWLWHIVEDSHFFLRYLDLNNQDLEFVAKLNKRRQLEWLASRYMMKKYVTEPYEGKVVKDKYGKPYLEQQKHQISISHSHDMTVLMFSPFDIGIDIQKSVAKITRISHKFMNEDEFNFSFKSTQDLYHIIWGAKESMYKAYGRKSVDFKRDMQLLNVIDKDGLFHFKGILTKDKKYNYDLYAEKLDQYYLVYAILNNRIDESKFV